MDIANPKAYAEWNKGYLAALEDLLNDECLFPTIVEAREQFLKKEANVNRRA
jgi:hypothetical protein